MMPQMIAAQSVGKLAENKATPYVIGGVVLLVVGVAYFGIYRPLWKKLGLIDDGSEKLEKDLISMKAFDPNYGNPVMVSISYDKAKDLAERIDSSLSWYSDDEQAIFGAIQEAGSTHNLSLVSRMYAAKFNKSMISEISNNMNVAEMEQIEQIVKNFKS